MDKSFLRGAGNCLLPADSSSCLVGHAAQPLFFMEWKALCNAYQEHPHTRSSSKVACASRYTSIGFPLCTSFTFSAGGAPPPNSPGVANIRAGAAGGSRRVLFGRCAQPMPAPRHPAGPKFELSRAKVDRLSYQHRLRLYTVLLHGLQTFDAVDSSTSSSHLRLMHKVTVRAGGQVKSSRSMSANENWSVLDRSPSRL